MTLRGAVPVLREAQWGEWEGKLRFCALWLFSTSAGPWQRGWSWAAKAASGATYWQGVSRFKSPARQPVRLVLRTHTTWLGPGSERCVPAYDHAISLSGIAAVNKLLYGSSVSDKPNCPQLCCLGPLSSPT